VATPRGHGNRGRGIVRPRLTPLVLAGFAAAGVVGAASAVPTRPLNVDDPAYILVSAREFHFTPSRRELPAGPVVVQLRNIGEDSHDLAIVNRAGRTVARVPSTRPGTLGKRAVRLTRGRYRLICTIADHARRGMRSQVSVKRDPR
jgi:hypothetical protein